MSDASVSVEILSPHVVVTGPAGREASTLKFEERLVAPFILQSLSAKTRESYRHGISEFFRQVGWLHPAQMTAEHVLRYRDRLIRDRHGQATIAQKLSVVRSFFSNLQAAGVVELKPASSLRLSEACSLRRSSITARQGRWVISCKSKEGRDDVWLLPTDVKEAIDDYSGWIISPVAPCTATGPTASLSSCTGTTACSTSTSRSRPAWRRRSSNDELTTHG